MQPRTIWIGGSYHAAAGLPEPVAPPVPLRSRVLELVVSTPGLSSGAICSLLEPVLRSTTSSSLHSLKVAGAIYSIRTSVCEPGSKTVRTLNLWFPGKPNNINRMKVGRPRKAKA